MVWCVRWFLSFLLLFSLHQMSTSLFRLIGGVCRTMVVSGTGGSISLFMIFLLGGYVVPKGLYLTNSLFLLIGCYRLTVLFAPQTTYQQSQYAQVTCILCSFLVLQIDFQHGGHGDIGYRLSHMHKMLLVSTNCLHLNGIM